MQILPFQKKIYKKQCLWSMFVSHYNLLWSQSLNCHLSSLSILFTEYQWKQLVCPYPVIIILHRMQLSKRQYIKSPKNLKSKIIITKTQQQRAKNIKMRLRAQTTPTKQRKTHVRWIYVLELKWKERAWELKSHLSTKRSCAK